MENTMTLREKLFGSGKGYVKRNAGILIGLLVICIVISISSNKFLTQENLMNVLRQISTNLYLASGMTMILICGGIDLSVGSIIAITGVTAGTLLNMGLPIPLVILGCLMMGALYGTINGAIISRTTLPPFIVTYSMMQILRGATYVYTGGTTVRIDNRAWINLGTGYAFDFLPLPVIYLLVLLVIVFLILNKTRLGRHVYAVGGNERAAKFSGISVRRTRMFVYIFSGVMGALAGMVLCARSYSGNPLAGNGAEMDAIAACVLGGTSMAGGYGYIGGTLIGALIIGLLNNGLNLMRIDSYWQIILKGIVILVAVYVDYVKNLKKAKAV
ncbi:MAG TPA: ABC transporter permease [Candidatus Limiplasma sp.]|nr:ABC transporter permease [Candidatus Limiplasma sp.]HPS80457.1 ABC transporter permease [Candidatus Limiplasma sp.]